MPDDLEEFVDRTFSDPRYFAETCTMIRYEGGAVGPWRWNGIQGRKFDDIYKEVSPGSFVRDPNKRHTLTLKSRQYGETTWNEFLIYHQFRSVPGWVSNVVGYRQDTVSKLKKIVNLFHLSAWEFFKGIGLEPAKYLPTCDIDRAEEMECRATGARIAFTTEGAKGAGRSLTLNQLYGTELAEWDDAEEAISGFIGSMAKDNRRVVDLDFTAKGVGNYAAEEWNAATDPEQESVYVPFFFGRNDFAYDPVFLDEQRKILKQFFNREYPESPEMAFRELSANVFDFEQIEATEGVEYYEDLVSEEALKGEVFCYGVDPTVGTGEEGTYAVIKVRHLKSGREACEPYRKRVTPRVVAMEIDKLLERFPGLVVVERNDPGRVVISELENHGRGDCLYVHDDGVEGYPKDKTSKLFAERAMEEALEENARSVAEDGVQTHVVVSPNGRRELQQYCVRKDGSHGHPAAGRTGKKGKQKFFDDEADAEMLEVLGREQAASFWSSGADDAVITRSTRTE